MIKERERGEEEKGDGCREGGREAGGQTGWKSDG